KGLLNMAPGIRVVVEASSGADLLTEPRLNSPCVVLLTLEGDRDHPFAVLGQLVNVLSEHARALVLTGDDDPDVHEHFVELGAMGVVTKNQTGDLLVKAIRKVHAGEIWLDRRKTAGVISHLARRRRADEDPDAA